MTSAAGRLPSPLAAAAGARPRLTAAVATLSRDCARRLPGRTARPGSEPAPYRPHDKRLRMAPARHDRRIGRPNQTAHRRPIRLIQLIRAAAAAAAAPPFLRLLYAAARRRLDCGRWCAAVWCSVPRNALVPPQEKVPDDPPTHHDAFDGPPSDHRRVWQSACGPTVAPGSTVAINWSCAAHCTGPGRAAGAARAHNVVTLSAG